jgi:citrate lyase subunit beta/citryl-CoA lyase
MTRLLRSVLFVPGTRQDRFAKALDSGADAVVCDLEDSVDASRKVEARHAIAGFLATESDSTGLRLVRLNRADSRWFLADLAFVSGLAAIQGVVLPKTETASQVEQVGQAMGSRAVFPLLETSRGILNAAAIAGARATIPALLFGAEDLTAQLGVPRTVEGEELIVARSIVVLAAATVGADAIDAVFTDLTATDRLRQDAARARNLGFRGKMAIHPGQIAVINEVFSPSAEEVDQARRLVEAFGEAQARGEGVIRLDGRMIDAPLVTRARRVLALSDELREKPPRGGSFRA